MYRSSLQYVAKVVFSGLPSSIPGERSASIVNWVDDPRRANLKASTLLKPVALRDHYNGHKPRPDVSFERAEIEEAGAN